jgi:hypothetical protein
MSKIRLDESGKILDLKSYKAKDSVKIEEAAVLLRSQKITLHDFRKTVVLAAYTEFSGPELDEWPSSDLAQLGDLVGRYATGGVDAVKNFLLSGDGTQASPAGHTAGTA